MREEENNSLVALQGLKNIFKDELLGEDNQQNENLKKYFRFWENSITAPNLPQEVLASHTNNINSLKTIFENMRDAVSNRQFKKIKKSFNGYIGKVEWFSIGNRFELKDRLAFLVCIAMLALLFGFGLNLVIPTAICLSIALAVIATTLFDICKCKFYKKDPDDPLAKVQNDLTFENRNLFFKPIVRNNLVVNVDREEEHNPLLILHY
jgi:hypothetical protein